MESTKDRFISIGGTVGFHLLLVLFLVIYYIKPSFDSYSEDLEGVPVMFGNAADAFGDDEPFGRGSDNKPANDVEVFEPKPEPVTPTPPQPQQSAAPAVNESPVYTQDIEEAVEVKATNKAEEEKKRQAAIEAERVRQEKIAAEQKASLEAKQKEEISKQMAGLFGNGSGEGSRGNTEGTGTQGVPTGNASYGKTTGVGGWGSYDLGGRGVGRGGLIKPTYVGNDYGTVVVDIIVDPQGNVVNATLGRGTNTTSTTLKNESLAAARRTKFIAVSKTGNQKGTITYMFNLN
ncbi:TonB family protein [Dysgonomonas sp. 216]|uniref:TonB family protein n=1 Tax=Dysgonomonas sp. 216 TaxID=2302934 RepID=UPI0013D866E6|nr:TonB family protein [Dysgonomonas sp. 216]NDW17484.1 TonB family protein [Dysgonomonas sp. 216]